MRQPLKKRVDSMKVINKTALEYAMVEIKYVEVGQDPSINL